MSRACLELDSSDPAEASCGSDCRIAPPRQFVRTAVRSVERLSPSVHQQAPDGNHGALVVPSSSLETLPAETLAEGGAVPIDRLIECARQAAGVHAQEPRQ